MEAPSSHQAFVLVVRADGGEEHALVDGRIDPLPRAVKAPWIARPEGAIARVRRGFGFLLKQAARGLYISPLLFVLKLFLLPVSSFAAAIPSVLFSLLVVGFFAVLEVYIAWSIVWWLFGREEKPFCLLPPPDERG